MTAIILAAGYSKRFGEEKLLKPIEGKPMVMHVIDLVTGLGFDEAILVYRNEAVGSLAENKGAAAVYNPEAHKGMSTSVICGIKNSYGTDAYIFFPGDQPFISKDTVIRLQEAFYDTKGSIIVPVYSGRRGNPVIFSAVWKSELEKLEGDTGGRIILESHPEMVYQVPVEDGKAGMDIDTWEEYASLL